MAIGLHLRELKHGQADLQTEFMSIFNFVGKSVNGNSATMQLFNRLKKTSSILYRLNAAFSKLLALFSKKKVKLFQIGLLCYRLDYDLSRKIKLLNVYFFITLQQIKNPFTIFYSTKLWPVIS